jgi:hypothetical protein
MATSFPAFLAKREEKWEISRRENAPVCNVGGISKSVLSGTGVVALAQTPKTPRLIPGAFYFSITAV